jgi:hypothetical protein
LPGRDVVKPRIEVLWLVWVRARTKVRKSGSFQGVKTNAENSGPPTDGRYEGAGRGERLIYMNVDELGIDKWVSG